MQYRPETLISQLPLNKAIKTRIFNCLYSSDIYTIGDVMHVSKERLCKIDNFGERCYDELQRVLADNGFRMKEEVHAVPPIIDLKKMADGEIMAVSLACNQELIWRKKKLSMEIREARKATGLSQYEVIEKFARDNGDKIKVYENQYYNGKLPRMRHLLMCLERYANEMGQD